MLPAQTLPQTLPRTRLQPPARLPSYSSPQPPGRSSPQSPPPGLIRGRLVDDRQKTLPAATVLLKTNADSLFVRSQFSDESGAFTFHSVPAGDYYLVISRIGFDPWRSPTLLINNDTAYGGTTFIDLGLIILHPAGDRLADVTVKARAPLIDRQLDKTVVDVAHSITAETSTVLEVMQRLPGVQVSSEGAVTINGRSGVNVFIDGKPTYLSAADLAALLGGMPASTIQKIEIMTNPPAKYDASGTSGIINIVRKKNRKPGFNGSVNANLIAGHYGRYNGSAALSYKNNHINFVFNSTYTFNRTLFNRQVTSDILNPGQSLLTEQVSNNNNINRNGTYRPVAGIDWYMAPGNTLSLSATGGTGYSFDRTISSLDLFDSNRVRTNHADFSSSTGDHPFNYTTTLQWDRTLDTLGREITVDLDYSAYRNAPRQSSRTRLDDAGYNFIETTEALLTGQRRLHIYSAKADYTHPLRGNGRLETGLKTSYVRADNDNTYYNQLNGQDQVDSSRSDYSMNSEQINAVYADAKRSYNKITAEAGLRAEQTTVRGRDPATGPTLTRMDFQLFPTFFLQYKENDANTFILRTGRRTERPAYSEMVPFRRPLTPTLYFQGNPNLRPDLSRHAEISWTWKNAFSVTAAYDRDIDYMQTLPYVDSNQGTITRRPTNVQAHSWNMDLGYSKKLTNWWSTDNTVSFYRNAFSGQAHGYDLTDPGILSVYASSSNSFQPGERLSAEVSLEYNSERRLAGSRFGPYSVVNIGLRRTMWNGRGSISLNGHNIFQSESHDVIDRYSGLNQYSWFHFYTRSVSLALLLRFGGGKPVKTSFRSGSAGEQQRAGN